MKNRLCAGVMAALLGCCLIGTGLYAARSEQSENGQPQEESTPVPAAQTQGVELREKMVSAREAAQIHSFYMDTPDGAYHFIRTDTGVNLDGEPADSGSFERMLELLLTMPVQEQTPEGESTADELAITLECIDGAQENVAVSIAGEDAWMLLDSGTHLHTDAWRIHTLMLACDGARMEE